MSDLVTVQTTVKFKAFAVPNFALVAVAARPRQDGFQPLPSIPLKELEGDVLDVLAKTWLDQLYASVGRGSPFYMVPKADAR